MLGPDGLAERQSAVLDTAVALSTMVPAPGVGWEVVVFGIQYAANNTVEIIFENSVPDILWLLAPNNGYPVFFSSYCVFRCGDNEPLNVNNVSLAGIRVDVQYEVRPAGL